LNTWLYPVALTTGGKENARKEKNIENGKCNIFTLSQVLHLEKSMVLAAVGVEPADG
jgi:hypothetical protein